MSTSATRGKNGMDVPGVAVFVVLLVDPRTVVQLGRGFTQPTFAFGDDALRRGCGDRLNLLVPNLHQPVGARLAMNTELAIRTSVRSFASS